MRRVVYAPEALIDLLKIQEHIEQSNPLRSETFVTELRAKAAKIAAFPFAYPPRYELAAGLRVAFHGHYQILFLATESRVEIARIVHGARDLRKMFEK